MLVLIVDDHELIRAGLALLLRDLFPDIELLHASTLSQGMSHALGELLNIVFLDLDLPDGYGCSAPIALKGVAAAVTGDRDIGRRERGNHYSMHQASRRDTYPNRRLLKRLMQP